MSDNPVADKVLELFDSVMDNDGDGALDADLIGSRKLKFMRAGAAVSAQAAIDMQKAGVKSEVIAAQMIAMGLASAGAMIAHGLQQSSVKNTGTVK